MQNRLIVLFLLLIVSTLAISQSPDVIQTYINTYKDLAVKEMQRSGVPAAVKLAQGIHETMAGTSDLVLSSNNHFGIKCKADWKGESVRHDDDLHQECFRKYPSAEDSYRDHSNFLKSSPRYSFLFNLDPTDYKGWAHGLKRAGYATNPKYPQIIIRLIEDYNLEDYTLVALGKKQEPLIRTVESKAPDWTTPPAEDPANPVLPVIQQNNTLPQSGTIIPKEEPMTPVEASGNTSTYPQGQFRINETPVIFVSKGTGYISIATQFNVPLARIFEFNDMKETEFADKDRLIYLQRKRKTGDHEIHKVKSGESLYDIAQEEAIRIESLLEYNMLSADQRPAVGETLNLRAKADHAPLLMLKETYVWNAAQPANNGIPALINYTVLPKETIYAIAKRFQVQIADIVKWNNLPGNELKAGQLLKIYK